MSLRFRAILFLHFPVLETFNTIFSLSFKNYVLLVGIIVHVRILFGEENGNPLQYSCLENPTDIGAWWAAVHGITKSWTHLSMHAYKSQRGGTRNGNPKVAVYFFECLTSASPRFCLTPSFTVSSGKATWALTLHHCTVLASKGHIPVCEASILNCHKRV